MIPFASQRGHGADLAAHLMNAQDNEFLEVADVRGTISSDLAGAFAEWEFQARTLTKCKNYLYSLSVNPDHSQGVFSRDQYMDYIARIEERLGLEHQPRAVVFHIKDGREHAHVVWSRIDRMNEKAIHMAFDREKLMMVTREFAREHGLELPAGYFKEKGAEKSKQISFYEKQKERETGLSRGEHIAKVTAIWKRCDNAKAFVSALAEEGYMLATGRKPFVLVDFYGGQWSLPRMIADKSIRQKHVEEFLAADYPTQELPTVDEAKSLMKDYRKSIETHMSNEERAEQFARQRRAQEKRREDLANETARLKEKQQEERRTLETAQRAQRDQLRRAYLAHTNQAKERRDKNRPHGLAAFLGRVTGVSLALSKLHKYQDKKRLQAFLEKRDELRDQQRTEGDGLQRRHDMQNLAMGRKRSALKDIERKEKKSLEDALKKETRIRARGKENQMPSLAKGLTPRGRAAAPHKAKARHYKPPTAKEAALGEEMERGFGRAVQGKTQPKSVDLEGDFNRASEGEKDGGKAGSSGGAKPKRDPRLRRFGRTRGKGKDLGRDR